MLIGTVHGDLHDIGKNIVTFMLDINGFEVKDIGIDVPVKKFIDEIKAYQPDVVGLSGFLTLAFDSMKETIAAFDGAGLRDEFKIMIGGGQIDETVRAYTGADAFGVNAVEAVDAVPRLDGSGGMSTMIGPYEQSDAAKAAYDARWERIMACVRAGAARPHAGRPAQLLLARQLRRHQLTRS